MMTIAAHVTILICRLMNVLNLNVNADTIATTRGRMIIVAGAVLNSVKMECLHLVNQ